MPAPTLLISRRSGEAIDDSQASCIVPCFTNTFSQFKMTDHIFLASYILCTLSQKVVLIGIKLDLITQ